MASRWRIRHKLLLGLGLVVCVMALLLGGTLWGLWSAYRFTNNVKDQLSELAAAEDFKTSVGELLAQFPVLLEKPADVPSATKKVREALDAYEEQLEETIPHGRDSLHGVLEKQMIEGLRKDLQALEKATESLSATRFGRVSTREDLENDQKVLERASEPLRRGALDLRNQIKDDLGNRFGRSKKNNYQFPLWIIVPNAVFGLLFVIWLMRSFYAWVFTPIRDLEAGVIRAARGDFRHRIDLHSGDEMEDLANAFNEMLERLQALYDDLAHQVNERSRQLVRSERLASVGFLAAGVAHEINNPLASIAFCSEALKARLNDLMRHTRTTGRDASSTREEHEIFSKYLKMIEDEAFRCKSITERLLEFSRTGERKREPTDLRALVQSVLDITQHLPNHRGKHITFEVPSDRLVGRISAWVNGEEIKSVILNLVVNALESMDEGGKLTIRLGQRDGMAELRFIDTGCGMSREVLENIFEPFFTRSRSGKGTGLGLTITHLIISQHGGDIEAASQGTGHGSTFIVRLPTQPTEPVAELTIGEERQDAVLPLVTKRAA